MLGGIKEGLKMGGRCGITTGIFCTMEEAVDRVRGTADFMSSVLAGLGIAGGFSLWSMHTSLLPYVDRSMLIINLCRSVSVNIGRKSREIRPFIRPFVWSKSRCNPIIQRPSVGIRGLPSRSL